MLDEVEQHFDGPAAHRPERLAHGGDLGHGGKLGDGDPGGGGVVESDD